MPKRILIVDDDRAILQSCSNVLADEGHEIEVAADGAAALAMLGERPFDLVLLDLKMPGMSGLETLRAARRLDPQLVVIIFTAYATIDTAVEAIKMGAFNYVSKPFKAAELVAVVNKALEHAELVRENSRLRQDLAARYRFESIVGNSRVMERTLIMLRKAAASDANVLLTGESGTGKELAARCIHLNSKRATGPFVPVDCVAIPDNLLESELFGHEKGAFTGAERGKRGLMEQADHGTLFLDEIGEMSISLQAKLLRTLQERSFRRLGGERLISVDIRIISSTNRDLEAEVRAGRFRSDLLFRLNVVHVQLPPLREREGDVALLCQHFLQSFASNYGRDAMRVSAEAMKLLESYHWPGNVRELRNVIERAVVLNETGTIDVSDLPEYIARAAELQKQINRTSGYKASRAAWVESQGKQYFSDLLARHKGNVSSAAREAQISRKTFYQLLHKFDLDPSRFSKS